MNKNSVSFGQCNSTHVLKHVTLYFEKKIFVELESYQKNLRCKIVCEFRCKSFTF